MMVVVVELFVVMFLVVRVLVVIAFCHFNCFLFNLFKKFISSILMDSQKGSNFHLCDCLHEAKKETYLFMIYILLIVHHLQGHFLT